MALFRYFRDVHGKEFHDLWMTFTVNTNDKDYQSFIDHEAPARRPGDTMIWFEKMIRKPVLEMCGVHKADKTGIFGKVLGFCLATEFQGNGLPHLHIILWLENRDLLETGIFI